MRTIKLKEFDFKDLFSRNKVLPGPGTWFRLDAALAIGGRNPKWKYVGDYDFWLRLAMKGVLVHRESAVAQWRHHSNSISISERGYGMAMERIKVIAEFSEKFVELLDASEVSLAKANSYYQAAKLGFFSIEVNSRKLLMCALRTDFRVLKDAKGYEILFMLLFPLSKKIVDTIKKFKIIRK